MTDRACSRREFVRGGVVAGGAAAAAAVLPSVARPAEALGAAIGDAAVLQFLISTEELVVFAYERALADGAPSRAAATVLSGCLAQEREHIAALAVNLARLGGAPPAAPRDLAAFERGLRALHVRRDPATLHTEREYIGFLIRLEAVAASAYHFAIEQLADDKLLQTAAQIMANEGQHATVLSELVSPGNVKRAVPSAFVGGSA